MIVNRLIMKTLNKRFYKAFKNKLYVITILYSLDVLGFPLYKHLYNYPLGNEINRIK